jgi:hypothetical protein
MIFILRETRTAVRKHVLQYVNGHALFISIKSEILNTFLAHLVHVCKLFIFSSSSLKPLNRFGPNLAEMFIGRSSSIFVILMQIGKPGPIMFSDWLKL